VATPAWDSKWFAPRDFCSKLATTPPNALLPVSRMGQEAADKLRELVKATVALRVASKPEDIAEGRDIPRRPCPATPDRRNRAGGCRGAPAGSGGSGGPPTVSAATRQFPAGNSTRSAIPGASLFAGFASLIDR
jgi:hypothetical protein